MAGESGVGNGGEFQVFSFQRGFAFAKATANKPAAGGGFGE
jgi:hypothetical protein